MHLTNDTSHPSSCTPNYTNDLFELLFQVIEKSSELGCSAIIQLGDLFHIKAPSRNSHFLVQRVMNWARSTSCPIFVVPGNHDLSNDRLESLSEGQPLGVLYSSGVVKPGWERLMMPDGQILPVYGIPWQMHWDAEQSVSDAAVKKSLEKFEPKDTPQLIVTHAPFFPPGSNPAYEHYSVEKFSRYVNPSGKSNVQVAYGHIHDRHGEYVVNGVRFANYGALSRGSLTESNLTRQVGFTIWDSITGRFEFIALQAKPAEQVFRIQEVTETKQKQLKLDEFLQSVGQSSIEITSIESVMAKVKTLKLGKAIEQVIEELLTAF